jgi:hypothetical protein
MDISDLLFYPVATVLQLPFQLILALPWLLLTWLLAVVTRGRLTARSRFLLLSGIAAAGLAPMYGHHGSMLPAYLCIIAIIGGSVDPLFAITGFIFTWGVTGSVFLLVGFGVARYRAVRDPAFGKERDGRII